MKRETIVLILFALAVMAGAASATISVPANYGNGKHLGIFFTEDDGTASPVTPSNKLPVDALVTIGSVSAEINLPRDGENTPYFALSQVASDALTLFNAWFAAANLDRLASTAEGLKVVATGVVRVSELPAVTGTVDVGNFPATQTITGTVVATIPETVTVSGTVTSVPSGTQTVTGTVDIGNFPATQTITGTVIATIPEAISVGNFPTNQTVSGNVGISGVASVTQAGASAFTQTARSAEATAASFTTSASCESVSLFSLASTTIWFSLDGSGATVSAGIPLTGTGTVQAQQSFSCGPSVTIWYIASNSSAFTSLESGR